MDGQKLEYRHWTVSASFAKKAENRRGMELSNQSESGVELLEKQLMFDVKDRTGE